MKSTLIYSPYGGQYLSHSSKPTPNSLYKCNTYITEHTGKQISKLDQKNDPQC